MLKFPKQKSFYKDKILFLFRLNKNSKFVKDLK
nr:MAG TPA: hypothetical protein [Caudoviricetes sp.]